jgi:hypothetical protein
LVNIAMSRMGYRASIDCLTARAETSPPPKLPSGERLPPGPLRWTMDYDVSILYIHPLSGDWEDAFQKSTTILMGPFDRARGPANPCRSPILQRLQKQRIVPLRGKCSLFLPGKV